MHLNAGKLDEKAHLRDSLRMTRSLKDHLNRETLPSPDNYHPHLLTIGSRATLDELHLGEIYDQKVSNRLNKLFRLNPLRLIKLSAWQ